MPYLRAGDTVELEIDGLGRQRQVFGQAENGGFDGMRALVTGGASGIGLATAQRLAADGASVAVLDSPSKGPEGFVYVRADVTDDAGVRSAVEAADEPRSVVSTSWSTMQASVRRAASRPTR